MLSAHEGETFMNLLSDFMIRATPIIIAISALGMVISQDYAAATLLCAFYMSLVATQWQLDRIEERFAAQADTKSDADPEFTE
jgi:hypothetical protein